LGRVKRLVGTGAPGPDGNLLKMSKSLNNAIFLSDDADTVQKKVMAMYTDPTKNPLWAFHETFNPDQSWVKDQQEAYRAGKVGDVAIKKKLVEVLNTLKLGTTKANELAEETLALAKKALRQDYFPRTLHLK